jgi:hypothetical protein
MIKIQIVIIVRFRFRLPPWLFPPGTGAVAVVSWQEDRRGCGFHQYALWNVQLALSEALFQIWNG